VALAAIQGLNAKLREELGHRDLELARLRDDAAALVARLERLERGQVAVSEVGR
jgi:ubiquinone biosynthesis protein UbiJ